MIEYIIGFDKALYDKETGETIFDMKRTGELIRCKDCKHHHYQNDIPYCDRIDYGYGWKDEDYCSFAERRRISSEE